MRRMARRAALVGIALAVVACSAPSEPSPSSTSGGSEGTVRIYAAASLADAFEAIAEAYEGETGVQLELAFDASSALRTQIIEGAPVDLFASADVANAQAIVDEGLADGETTIFADNTLAIVTPAEGESAIEAWHELAGDVRIVAAGEDVPITAYATQLVANLAIMTSEPEGFAAAYAANVRSREDNVRAVLAKVELGEADAGIVYRTDALGSDDVREVAIPDGANVRASHAFVTLADAAPDTAAFAAWLAGPDAQAILIQFGFLAPSA